MGKFWSVGISFSKYIDSISDGEWFLALYQQICLSWIWCFIVDRNLSPNVHNWQWIHGGTPTLVPRVGKLGIIFRNPHVMKCEKAYNLGYCANKKCIKCSRVDNIGNVARIEDKIWVLNKFRQIIKLCFFFIFSNLFRRNQCD